MITIENLSTSNINIIYINNVCKKNLGIIEYRQSFNDEFWNSFFNLLGDCGHNFNESYGRLYFISSQGIIPIEKGKEISRDISSVIYSEVTAPNNAYRYGEKDGVIFYFHTDENNHLFFPHIHASHSGKDMLISLESLEATGSLNNRNKNKLAIKYVFQNKAKLLKEWNRLIKK